MAKGTTGKGGKIKTPIASDKTASIKVERPMLTRKSGSKR